MTEVVNFARYRRQVSKPAYWVLDQAHPLSRGLIGYWPIGDTTAGTTPDVSRARNNGVPQSNPTFAPSHHGGLSLQLDGSASYVSATSVSTSVGMSVFGWYNPTALTNAYSGLATRFTSSTNFWQLFVKSTGKLALYFAFNAASASNNYDGTGSNTLSTGTWYFVGFTCPGTAAGSGYVNASLDGTTGTYSGTDLSQVTGTVAMGNDLNTAGRFFNGKMDNVRIYNRVLTQTEISWLYAEPYAGLYTRPQLYLKGTTAAAVVVKGSTLPMMAVG